MREILFRGKVRGNYNDYHSVIKDKGWLYGDLHQTGYERIYIDGDEWRLRVEPETVGQFTGLLDKNGNKIFEGDIVRFYEVLGQRGLQKPKKGFVSYQNGAYIIRYKENQKDRDWPLNMAWHIEIIGNIHDNGDLYKEIKGEIK
jgi:uncharacterized phage protein (TIGR01671 family)